MPENQNPIAEGDRVLWNALIGASTDPFTPSRYLSQLPPIIARHLWRADELAVLGPSIAPAVPEREDSGHG